MSRRLSKNYFAAGCPATDEQHAQVRLRERLKAGDLVRRVRAAADQHLAAVVEAVAKFAHLPMEKVYMNLQRYGNTSAASNLIALYEAVKRDKVIKQGDHVVMVAFGAGLTWGSLLLEW